MLSSRVFDKKLPIKDIESRPKFIVLIGGSLHKCCILRLSETHFYEDFCHEFLQVVNMYGIAFISGNK